ncbi:acyl-CoA dehydrogenase family protein [Sporichthya sp.]|uniref:acyl-CoA dehydrogenase family protein n=1 Tax=Sporichthya sp. TaxID=65475 RepID=UPI0018559B69|nr:acyl-CoA dehydrogenase family protein [Sporichthya sp.]MBA3743226.1 acyl-CoA dehydrogenase family protein [Sporichthya sp.]
MGNSVHPDTDESAIVDAAIAKLLQAHPPARTETQELLGAVFDSGLAWIHFPVGIGGLGLSTVLHQYVYSSLTAAGVPDYISETPIGYGMAGPTIAEHGTEAQIAHHLRRIFTGEFVWCQLFSEPGAGSDLASLSTRAVPTGDGWLVNGQKVWTTLGHLAQYGLLVARTDPDALKHQGLTYFLLDMTLPGVEVRPLRQMSGDAEFNEVYLSDVLVPDSARIGGVGEGWGVAMTTLANERLVLGATTPRHGGAIDEALALWSAREDKTSAAARVLRDRLLDLWIRDDVAWLTGARAAQRRESGPGPEGSVSKIARSSINQQTYELCADLRGAASLIYSAAAALDGTAQPGYMFLRSRAQSIEGGSSEVLRDVVAHRVLGLPPSHRPDKGIPWNEVPRS